MRRRAVLVRALTAAVLAAALIVSGCSASSTVSLKVEHTGSITWTPCGKVQCATLSVPLDYTRPDGPRIDLALARRPASRQATGGVLLTNPGGPGGSGVDFLRDASGIFSANILRAFDIVSWDPRGAGQSAPVKCVDDLDAFYALNRDPKDASQVSANVATTRQFVDACKQRSAKELPYVSSLASVHDMDAIRAAMGADRISYFGFSYGTYLGAQYANTFPQRVRAMTLDGAVDPARSYAATVTEQAQGFEQQLDAFFDWCKRDSKCDFARGGDPRAAFDTLQHDLADESEPARVDGEPRTLGPGEFEIGVASALYPGAIGYQNLADALAQTARGQGDKLVEFSDSYTERTKGGKYSNETAALYAIGCLDGPSPRTVAAVQALAASAARVAPHFGAQTVWLGLPCTLWPAKVVGKIAPVHAASAPPIVVVGTTRDPATPYAWAQALARQLRNGTLLTFAGSGHTGYGRGSECLDQAVDRYLVSLTVPPADTRCTT